MKILYAVQATGNGHISRAMQILPYLEKHGHVDFFLSGDNASLKLKGNVKFRSKGLSLFYTQCGGLNYWQMWQKNQYFKAIKEARDLPVYHYDLVINDFDFITAESCRIHKKASIHLGHQASFLSSKTPRPDKKSSIGEFIYKNYCKTSHYLGFHFEKYDSFILPPVIKREVLEAEPDDLGHITVYLPSYQRNCLEPQFAMLKNHLFHWFLHGVKQPFREGNIIFYPIDSNLFNKSLTGCHGLITGGGFETPSEALFLGKKLMCIPIRDHYEQKCNAAALEKIGVFTLPNADSPTFYNQVRHWLSSHQNTTLKVANDVDQTVERVLTLMQNTGAMVDV